MVIVEVHCNSKMKEGIKGEEMIEEGRNLENFI